MRKFYLIAFLLIFLLAAYVVVFLGGVVKFGSIEINPSQSVPAEKNKLPNSSIDSQEQNASVKGSGTAVNASGGASVDIKR